MGGSKSQGRGSPVVPGDTGGVYRRLGGFHLSSVGDSVDRTSRLLGNAATGFNRDPVSQFCQPKPLDSFGRYTFPSTFILVHVYFGDVYFGPDPPMGDCLPRPFV